MSSVIDTIRRKEVLTYNFEGDIPVLRKILDDTKYKLEFRHKCADLLLMIEHRHSQSTNILERLKYSLIALKDRMNGNVPKTAEPPAQVNQVKPLRKEIKMRSNYKKDDEPEKIKYVREQKDQTITQSLSHEATLKLSRDPRQKMNYDNKNNVDNSQDNSLHEIIDRDIRQMAEIDPTPSTSSQFKGPTLDYKEKYKHCIKKKNAASTPGPAVALENLKNNYTNQSNVEQNTPKPSQLTSSNLQKNSLDSTGYNINPLKDKHSMQERQPKISNVRKDSFDIINSMNSPSETTVNNEVLNIKKNITVTKPFPKNNPYKDDKLSATVAKIKQKHFHQVAIKHIDLPIESNKTGKNANKKQTIQKGSFENDSTLQNSIRKVVKVKRNLGKSKRLRDKRKSDDEKSNTNESSLKQDDKNEVSKNSNEKIPMNLNKPDRNSNNDENMDNSNNSKNTTSNQMSPTIDKISQNHEFQDSNDCEKTGDKCCSETVLEKNENEEEVEIINTDVVLEAVEILSSDDSDVENQTVDRKLPLENSNYDKKGEQIGSDITSKVAFEVVTANEDVNMTPTVELENSNFEVQLELSAIQAHRNEKEFRKEERILKMKITRAKNAKQPKKSVTAVKSEPIEDDQTKKTLPSQQVQEKLQEPIATGVSQHALSMVNNYEIVNVPVQLEDDASHLGARNMISQSLVDSEHLNTTSTINADSLITIIKSEHEKVHEPDTFTKYPEKNVTLNYPKEVKKEAVDVSECLVTSTFNFDQECVPMIKEELIKPDDLDLGKHLHIISNLGYIDSPKTFLYICQVEGCAFLNDNRNTMSKHLKYHFDYYSWDGYCKLCDSQIIAEDCNLQQEFDHLLLVHVKTNDVITINDDDDDGSDNNENTLSQQPAIKLRKLDDLVSVSSSFVSNSNYQLNLVENPTEEKLLLKPWVYQSKKNDDYVSKTMLDKKSLARFYKCMDIKCRYSISSPDNFFDHLIKHEFLNESKEYLECCYCDFTANEILQLKNHFNDEHKFSHYQCPYCFYRGCAKVYVIRHQQLFHNSKNKIFLKCSNIEPFQAVEFIPLRNNSVKAYVCSICSFSTYITLIFEKHLECHKNKTIICEICKSCGPKEEIINHLKDHGFDVCQCLYCPTAFSSETEILNHLVNKHDGHKPPFYCLRELDSMENYQESGGTIDLVKIKEIKNDSI